MNPVILAIDTALGGCSVSLLQNGTVTHSNEEPVSGRQSARLVPMIEETLKAARLAYADCTAFACSIGPGGFTGIRVGLTTARALKLATGKPLIGLSTLEVIAFASGVRGDILSIIDAHRGQYYVQRFRRLDALVPLSDALLVEEKMLAPLGHGAKKVQAPVKADDVALLAQQKWLEGERVFPSTPLYIRPPDAKLPQSADRISSAIIRPQAG